MTDKRPNRQELVALLQTKGWDVVTGTPATPTGGQTLEQAARDAHARHQKGETPELIQQAENKFQLDLIQLQQLWEHLGLPM
jgi:hypothetical protein